jgi:hypothetical protein
MIFNKKFRCEKIYYFKGCNIIEIINFIFVKFYIKFLLLIKLSIILLMIIHNSFKVILIYIFKYKIANIC